MRRPHDGYRHEAFLWRGEEEFLAGTVPFVRNGLAAGEPVMAALTPDHIGALREALGSQADRVMLVDMSELGANPARLIPAWRRFTAEHGLGRQPVRGIGEPIWVGRRSAEMVECQLHEALLNMAFDPHTPLWLLCPYDATALPMDVLAEAHRSHPLIVEGDAIRGSTTYSGAEHVEVMFEAPLPAVQEAASARMFEEGDFADLRTDVRAHAAAAGLSPARTDDLVLVVHEIAVNAAEHGHGQGELRIWQEHQALVCEVRSSGRIQDPMVGRRPPERDRVRGRGLWLANQLCDLVQIRSGDDGTTVRAHTWL